jgi:DNA-binding NarL/FixJ family response regulator
MSTPEIAPTQYRPIQLPIGVPADARKIGYGAGPSALPDCQGSPGPELSPREIEVLRYLPTMLTAADIGTELYISVNTVKAHMRSIYCKLGVSRRREAVVRASASGILERRFPG